MQKLPTFQSDEEQIAWFDTHDTGPYMAEVEPADEEFPTRPVDLRLRTDVLVAIETLAARRGVPYQRLMQIWLLAMLRQEAPDLVPHAQR